MALRAGPDSCHDGAPDASITTTVPVCRVQWIARASRVASTIQNRTKCCRQTISKKKIPVLKTHRKCSACSSLLDSTGWKAPHTKPSDGCAAGHFLTAVSVYMYAMASRIEYIHIRV